MTQPLSLKKEKNQGINNSINNQRKAKEETRPETVNPLSLTMATFIIGVIKLVSLSLSVGLTAIHLRSSPSLCWPRIRGTSNVA